MNREGERERTRDEKSITQNAQRDDGVMQQQARDAELYLKYEIDSLIRAS